MPPRPLSLLLIVFAACGEHKAERRVPSAEPGSSIAPVTTPNPRPVPSAPTVTAVFEDEVHLVPLPAPRPPTGIAPAGRRPDLSDVYASLSAQLASRDGIEWNATRPLNWGDFHGTPEEGGRTAALTSTGQIFGASCSGTLLRFGAIAAFIPSESWVRPRVAADPMQGPRALSHEQLHFTISEIIARELRRTYATVEHPCAMRQSELDALGAASFNEERTTQERYDAETNHGLDAAAQQRWQMWASRTLDALADYATPVGSRND